MAVACAKWIITLPNTVIINRFYSKPKINFNDSILETLSMSEKAFKILLHIFGNVNGAARLAWGQPPNLKSELYKSCLHKLSINTSEVILLKI